MRIVVEVERKKKQRKVHRLVYVHSSTSRTENSHSKFVEDSETDCVALTRHVVWKVFVVMLYPRPHSGTPSIRRMASFLIVVGKLETLMTMQERNSRRNG